MTQVFLYYNQKIENDMTIEWHCTAPYTNDDGRNDGGNYYFHPKSGISGQIVTIDGQPAIESSDGYTYFLQLSPDDAYDFELEELRKQLDEYEQNDNNDINYEYESIIYNIKQQLKHELQMNLLAAIETTFHNFKLSDPVHI